MPLLSVVIPVFCEELVLPALLERLERVLAAEAGLEWEILLVDDGSRDRSWALIEQAHARDPRIGGLRLTRNFGHQRALTAGLDRARGDAVLVLDADLQDPPELLPSMLQAWREGSAVVYGQRASRDGEGWFKRASASAFYRLLTRLSSAPTPRDAGDFYLLDRRVVDELCAMRERGRYLRGMVFWLGFPGRAVPYARDPRRAGRTKFGLGRMLRFALDGLLSSSSLPLTAASYVGFASALLGLALGVWAVFEKLADPGTVVGWTSTLVVVLFLGGVQLATIGILGLYVGRIYDETRQRPLYLVERGLEPSASQATAGSESRLSSRASWSAGRRT